MQICCNKKADTQAAHIEYMKFGSGENMQIGCNKNADAQAAHIEQEK
jgi:hypothetical protein